MIYLLLKLNLISETDNCIGFKLDWQVNHGPESNSEFFIEIRIMHFKL